MLNSLVIQKGVTAREGFVPLSECPYAEGTFKHKMWVKGWRQQDRRDSRLHAQITAAFQTPDAKNLQSSANKS
jgi:ribosome modulation factor